MNKNDAQIFNELMNVPCYTCVHFKKDNLDDRIDDITGLITIGKCNMLNKRCRAKPNNVADCAYFKESA